MLVLAWIGLITVSLVAGGLVAMLIVADSSETETLAVGAFGPVVLITGYLLWVNVLQGGG